MAPSTISRQRAMLRATSFQEAAMKNVCWLLIGLAALAYVVGAILAFAGGQTFLLTPPGYWRGAVGFLLFAIALRMMDEKKA
jgi:uncharacterized membrane protein YfcA